MVYQDETEPDRKTALSIQKSVFWKFCTLKTLSSLQTDNSWTTTYDSNALNREFDLVRDSSNIHNVSRWYDKRY